MTHLILQVLGNSDIQIGNKTGVEAIGDQRTPEQIQAKIQRLQRLQNQSFNMPLLALTRTKFNNDDNNDVRFAFILTQQPTTSSPEILKSDGIWWKNILENFFNRENVNGHLLEFQVDNAADWEKMADKIRPFLNCYFTFDFGKQSLHFNPTQNGNDVITVDRLTIQHSSGTPALVGALYLWGIEKKVAGIDNIDFLYISSEDKICPEVHQGHYWQWRLKDSQIRELLEIQDFSGARQLLDKNHTNYKELAEGLEDLDKALSFNLMGQFVDPRKAVIERIGIALWSEKAFEHRHHWMHWYLRMAGAFELAILLLVEKQGCGSGKYRWQDRKLKFIQGGDTVDVARADISNLVKELLSKGKFKKKIHTIEFYFDGVDKMTESEWPEFRKFYVNCWVAGLGFIAVRNQLYHSLLGDEIDWELDANPQLADTAVQWLNQLVQWVGIEAEIEACKDKYTGRVNQVKEWLQ
ncbi:hypothetical protein [Roseofilum capinflatum]|uniref:Uncharacterized protein n=1 Tax=Roseofilum capinflatum BLCC-M114 TaxID=3022440 RepID=A0ABT7BD10_9CYAN|nr:hypothetical protein [Roseofilum capinflatum]MDJ1177056.1 hypothetical protein [Roseofilum capinflatum BLCC-M114]